MNKLEEMYENQISGNLKTKSPIPYRDKSYEDKRRILRQYAIDNGFAYEMKLFILDEISQGLKSEILPGIEIDQYLNVLLVDGYVAYERIFNEDQTKIIDYEPIDPTTLSIKHNGTYIQYQDYSSMERVLLDKQILYIMYPILDANESLIGQIYTKQVKLYNHDKLNDFMISYIVKKVKTQLTDIIKQERDFFDKK